MSQILSILQEWHPKGIIYGDFKPVGFLVCVDIRLRIYDLSESEDPD